MQIFALQNTDENTNNISIDFEGVLTLREILNRDDVKRFFCGSEDPVDCLDTIDGIDASAIDNYADLKLDASQELAFDTYGERQAAPVESTVGYVSIMLNGGFEQKRAAIENGKTTVANVMTDSTAAFLGTSTENLRNMRVFVNDTETSSGTVLHDGDVIMFQARKAGDKGATAGGLIMLRITGGDKTVEGSIRVTAENEDDPLEVVLYKAGFGDSYGMRNITLKAVNGAAVPNAVYALFLGSSIRHIESLNIELDDYTDLHVVYTGDDEEEVVIAPSHNNIASYVRYLNTLYAREFNAIGLSLRDPVTLTVSDERPAEIVGDRVEKVAADSVEEEEDNDCGEPELDGPEVGTFGVCKVCRTAGFDSIEVGIQSGVTTLRSVMQSKKVLDGLAITTDHISTLNYTINDVSATLDDVVSSGDVICCVARKAGDKGFQA